MDWFVSDFYPITALAVGVIAILIDWWQLHTGKVVHYKLVSHRKLRAAAGRRPRAADAPTAAARREPAPGLAAGAGAELQAATEAWIEGLRCDHTSAQSPIPAPGRASGAPGVGLEPRSVVNASSDAPPTAHLPDGGPGPQQPVDDTDPPTRVVDRCPDPGPPSAPRDTTSAASAAPQEILLQSTGEKATVRDPRRSVPEPPALTGAPDSGAGVPRAPAPGQAA